MLSNNAESLMSMQRAQGVLLFLVLVVNSTRFRILCSYTLLLYLPVLMRSCLRLCRWPLFDELAKAGHKIEVTKSLNHCDTSLENMPTSHAVSLAQVIYAWSNSAMPLCRALAYVNGVCLHLLVPPLVQYWCFFLNITACTTA